VRGFHELARLFVPVGNAAFRQIVRRELHRDTIARQNADAISPELASQVSQNSAVLIDFHAEQTAGEFFYYGASDFDAVFFTHSPPELRAGHSAPLYYMDDFRIGQAHGAA
jgi:hypothetical protein